MKFVYCRNLTDYYYYLIASRSNDARTTAVSGLFQYQKRKC